MEVNEPSAKYLIQQTAGGVPDWRDVKLGAAASLRTGPFGSALHKSDYVFGGVPIVNPMQIEDGRIKPTERMSVVEEAAERLSEFRLRSGDVVIGRRGEMGRCAFVHAEQDGWLCGTGSMIVRPGVLVDGRFLQRVLSSNHAVRAIESASVGTTMINLNQRTLADLDLHIPISVNEQTAIADALAEADALIDSLEQLLTKKRQIKQGTMQELLTGKRRLPGFHDAWVLRSMADLFEFSGGLNASRDQLGDAGACYLHYGDIHLSSKTYIDLDLEHHQMPRLEVDVRKVSPTSLLQHGDVVFVDASEDDQGVSRHVVIHCQAARPLISGLHTIVARPRTDELIDLYKRYCFQAPAVQAQFRFYAVGTKVSGVSKGNIGKIVLSIPSLAEQAEIAACLSEIDAEICALEDRITKARALKQGMARALLTGRIRLVEPTA